MDDQVNLVKSHKILNNETQAFMRFSLSFNGKFKLIVEAFEVLNNHTHSDYWI